MPPLKIDVQVNDAGASASVASASSKAPPSVQATSKATELEVDYDHDITRLYEAITNEDWDAAIDAVHSAPAEARTWVVRHHPDGDIMWRFLPLHSACARQPPVELITALLDAYRPAASTCDDQGLFPLHYAAGNQASSAVIKTLLLNHPDATAEADPTGMLPLHYLAKWGPSDKLCLDILLLTNQKAAFDQTEDGETALELALEGEYDEDLKEAVVTTLRALTGETAGLEAEAVQAKTEVVQQDEAEVQANPTDEQLEVISTISDTASRSIAKDSVDGPTVQRAPSMEREAAAVAPPAPVPKAEPATSNLADLQKIFTLEKELAALREERRTTAIAHEEQLAAAKAEHERQLTVERAELNGQILFLEEEMAKLQSTNKELTTERASKDEFLRYIEGRLAEKDYEMLTLQKSSEAITKEHADFKVKYEALQATSDANAARFAKLQQSAAALLAEHEKITAAVSKKESLFKAATKRRQAKMQELINMEVELTRDAVADEREGEGSYLHGAIERQQKEMILVMDTVQDAITGAIPATEQSEEEEI